MTTDNKASRRTYHLQLSSSQKGWAFLLFAAVLVAGILRFWALDIAPPGLYRDEAFNGLDALSVIDGNFPIYFEANNGREPLYIYFTALAVAIFGKTTLAIRATAALAGTLTTVVVFLLGKSWFDQRTGLIAAWLWAITLWPIHLSRVGFRAMLLAPLLGLAFWAGTEAYRRRQPAWWVFAGLLYGLGFYTYLAFRFTPLLLLLFAIYLLIIHKQKDWVPQLKWFVVGSLLTLAPLLIGAVGQPELLGIGRVGQVSILDPAVNKGNFWMTLWQHSWQAIGLFIWQGDEILRHNPAGRPVFDWLMAIPWLVGIVVCAIRWRRPAYMALLLWQIVMLGPTILAEDAPHFLRAAGLFPAIVLVPALGLSQCWRSSKLARWIGGPILLLIGSSLFLTVRDYRHYVSDADTGYLFESAARELAHALNNDMAAGTPSYVDERFWSGWTSLPFLLEEEAQIHRYQPENGLPTISNLPAVVYVWPFQSHAFIRPAIPENGVVTIAEGALARGDLESNPYPLYASFGIARSDDTKTVATFDNQFKLHVVNVTFQENEATVDLGWSIPAGSPPSFKLFLHVTNGTQIIGQLDIVPGQGYWPPEWHDPGIVVVDHLTINVDEIYDPAIHSIWIGLYDTNSLDRIPVAEISGASLEDAWQLPSDYIEFSTTR